MQSDGRPSGLSWNYDREELLADGVVHTVGVGLALIGAVLLIIVSGDSTQVVKTGSVLIYAAGLLTMLGISAAYNMWPASPRKWLLRRFDHSAIYLLIAATYTPFIAQMKVEIATVGLLLAVWCFAIVGIVLKLALPGRLDRLSIGLYLLLGWSGMMAYEPVAATLPGLTLWLIAAGGVLYSTGIIFHLSERLRFQNALWHCFVLMGALCHYMAVLDCVALKQATASFPSGEWSGQLLVSSAGDRAGESVRGSVNLRAHEGTVVEISQGGTR
jgi:hemolysin III